MPPPFTWRPGSPPGFLTRRPRAGTAPAGTAARDTALAGPPPLGTAPVLGAVRAAGPLRPLGPAGRRRPCRRRAALRPPRFPLRLGCRPDHPPTIRPVTEVVCFPADPGLPSPLTSARDQPGPARSAARFRPLPGAFPRPAASRPRTAAFLSALRPGQQAQLEAPSCSRPCLPTPMGRGSGAGPSPPSGASPATPPSPVLRV